MKIKVVSRKFIKPSAPTPPHLKNYSISFLDESIAILLFYPSKPDPKTRLEESLAEILVQFYPLAGRYLKQHCLVDCNDEGAEFVLAEAPDFEIKDLVGKMETRQLYDLVPSQVDEAATTPLLSIQVTQFRCGGSVICISFSHRVFDASSTRTFVAAWSNATHPRPGGVPVNPTWDFPSRIPRRNTVHVSEAGDSPDPVSDNKVVIKGFLFRGEAIARMRAKYTTPKVSSTRLVTALISKALIRMDCAEYARPRDCLIFQPVDMRWRTTPPMSAHSCGNFSLATLTRCIAADVSEGIEVRELIDILGDAVQRSAAEYAEMLSPEGNGYEMVTALEHHNRELRSRSDVNLLSFSDFSKFDFYENGDFGGGKPVWTVCGPMKRAKIIMLLSDREGNGIEARVHLDSHHMHRFQEDPDIKSMATYGHWRSHM